MGVNQGLITIGIFFLNLQKRTHGHFTPFLPDFRFWAGRVTYEEYDKSWCTGQYCGQLATVHLVVS